MEQIYDVMIIGSGVVGSAIAREMARFDLKIGVLEKNNDVVFEASGRNSGVIHGGFSYDNDTLKAKYAVEGCKTFDKVAEELDVPFLRCGKVLVGNTKEDYDSLLETIEHGKRNGNDDIYMIDKEELHEIEPEAIGEFAMFSPLSGIIDPFQYTIALAENAKMNGVDFYFDNEVTDLYRDEDGLYNITTNQGTYKTRWVVNSAGQGATKISDMLGIKGYRIGVTKGNYILLDKKTGSLLNMPIYPVPSPLYMGIHLTNTIDGNVIIGPDAHQVSDPDYYGVSQPDMEVLAESANALWPHVNKANFIRNYSGVQTTWEDGEGVIKDFVIEARDEAPNSINLIGIESPGLTCALPIAQHAVKLMGEKEELKPNDNFNPIRKGIPKFADMTDEERARLIEEDPDYGEIICRCEKVTKAEILQAIHNPLGCHTVTSIKYRTRASMGRCQGGYCQSSIAELIEQELGEDLTDILYSRNGSNLFTGRVRE